MLITSDGYQRQYESLNLDDIKSAWFLLSALDTDYVAFYNCGQDGGCSRLHKHVNKEAGVNAIGMLGYIAVATRKEIDNWIQLGLTDSLRELGVAKQEEAL